MKSQVPQLPQLGITAQQALQRKDRAAQLQKMVKDCLDSIKELAAAGSFHLNLELGKAFDVDTGGRSASCKFADQALVDLVRARKGQEDVVFLMESLLRLGYHIWSFPRKPEHSDSLAGDRVMDNIQVNWEASTHPSQDLESAHQMHLRAKRAQAHSKMLSRIGVAIGEAADSGAEFVKHSIEFELQDLVPGTIAALEQNGFRVARTNRMSETLLIIQWGQVPVVQQSTARPPVTLA